MYDACITVYYMKISNIFSAPVKAFIVLVFTQNLWGAVINAPQKMRNTVTNTVRIIIEKNGELYQQLSSSVRGLISKFETKNFTECCQWINIVVFVHWWLSILMAIY